MLNYRNTQRTHRSRPERNGLLSRRRRHCDQLTLIHLFQPGFCCANVSLSAPFKAPFQLPNEGSKWTELNLLALVPNPPELSYIPDYPGAYSIFKIGLRPPLKPQLPRFYTHLFIHTPDTIINIILSFDELQIDVNF